MCNNKTQKETKEHLKALQKNNINNNNLCCKTKQTEIKKNIEIYGFI